MRTRGAFSLFQGVATRHEGSSEDQFVVPPLGRRRLASRNGSAFDDSA